MEKDTKNKNEFHTFESYQPHQLPVDSPKGSRKTRAKAWLKHHRKLVIICSVVLLIIVASVISYLALRKPKIVQSAQKPKAVVVEKIYSPLTGVEVSEADTQRPVTAVMIENSPEARPQSGLKDAGVVFESVAEAGITRFLVLYQEGQPDQIGPVRSVRPQFASWVAAFDAGLAHVGGSNIPLEKLRSGKIKDLDQFFNANTYTRVSNRAAPHNVYTTTTKLDALNKSKGYNKSSFTAWQRTTKEVPSVTPTAKTIAIPVSTGLFMVNYAWDQATNSYLRSEGGKPHLDREKGQISPKVVIAMQVPHDVIKDSNNYSYPDVNTSGSAWLFQDGSVSQISWSKAGDKDQVVFKDAAGKSVQLNRGQTWITAIKPDATPTWQ